MNLFMQGMRRSGTTIIFDILSQDSRFDLYYEPFSAGKKGALGGGSGVQQIDLMEKIHNFRAEFVKNSQFQKNLEFYNYGAPRDPSIELTADFDDACKQYIKQMTEQNPHSVFKFTRMYRKSAHLAALAPDSHFMLLIRDPKEIVASYLYGRNRCRIDKYHDRKSFFTRATKMNAWKSRDLYNGIIEQYEKNWMDVPDWIRPLILWDYTFKNTYADAKRAFGKRFRIFRYEDLSADPAREVQQVYDHVGLTADSEVINWALTNVKGSFKECYRDDPRWGEAFEKYSLTDSIKLAGYGEKK